VPPSLTLLEKVAATALLDDARASEEDLLAIKLWFDGIAGGEPFPCRAIYRHAIHRPASAAVPLALVSFWGEYQAALDTGEGCLRRMIELCDAGGGTPNGRTFWNLRGLSSSALSQCEHVVRAMEAIE